MRISQIICAAALAAGLTGPAMAKETLRFASFEPAGAFLTGTIFALWAEDVAAASEGTLEIKIFPGGTLGRDPAAQIDLVENGVADIAWAIPGYAPGRFDESTVIELPFLVKNSEAASYAAWKVFEDGLLGGDYDKFKMLGTFSSPPNMIAATIPLVEPSDMKGVNFRAPGPTQLKAIEATGAVPVGGITGPSLAEALNRDLIKGLSTEFLAVETFRLEELLTNYTVVPMGATPMLVIMNKQRYESLPDAAKAAIDKYSGAAFSERFGKAFDERVATIRERVTARDDVTIVAPTEAQVELWRDATSVATEDWLAAKDGRQSLYDAFAAAMKEHPASQ
ncbi:C4-dicarboxylate ABC transporter substrate-binding protein [Sulfitobacter alexandrii]|uniref:C4-dicarboxylate ABC transporter substrate-binding protein n=1 Tax=Sulfitobacter alexandrii TaxID=1917485 RepID=A0A1J0WDR4_9RHOB|nr:TRAP transporter substrate-binding protein [Sulfitobacter alexandrii]APE42463.1 C4-dicarboxylate ABC transporter substrate-binding protein [Sulfitobacter alexandrii]